MKKLMILGWLLVAVAVGWTMSCWRYQLPFLPGQERGSRGEGRSHSLSDSPVAEKLSLTPEQKLKIQEIEGVYRQKTSAMKKDLREKHNALEKALSSSADEPLLRQHHQALMQARRLMDEERFNGMLEVRRILNPEQIQTLSRLKGFHPGRKFPGRGWTPGGKEQHGDSGANPPQTLSP